MRRFLPLLAALCLTFAPAPFPKADRRGGGDLRAMQGEWVLHSTILYGMLMENRPGSVLVVEGNKFSHLSKGKVSARWAVVIDPAKEPKTMDKRDVEDDRSFLLCIYRLEGDTLSYCWNNRPSASGRPTDFTTGKDVGVATYKRIKR